MLIRVHSWLPISFAIIEISMHVWGKMVVTTRRGVLRLLAIPAAHLLAQQPDLPQGMASRHVKPTPRGKRSGLPFNAHFIDIAEPAGLKEVTVCGHVNRVDYVIEAMSCGAAFFDYDNDGWLDILVLSGSRFGDPPPECIKPSLQKQSKWYVQRRH